LNGDPRSPWDVGVYYGRGQTKYELICAVVTINHVATYKGMGEVGINCGCVCGSQIQKDYGDDDDGG
jgi:hypothetical protein